MTKKFLLPVAAIVVCSFLSTVTMAQPYVDLLNIKTQYFQQQPYNSDAGTKLGQRQYEGSFLLPMEQKNKDVIIFGGDAYGLNFNYTGAPSMKTYLYSMSLNVGYEKHWDNDSKKLLLLAIPKLNADHIEFTGKDFQMGGVALYTFKKNDNLKFDLGAYYNQEFFGPYIIPLVGINWKASEHINIFGDLPANMNFEYKFGSHFYAGASFLSIISSYRLNQMPGNMYVRDGDPFFGHDELKAYVNYYVDKHIVCYVEGGQTMGRMYQLYNSNNQLQNDYPVYTKNANAMFVNIGLAYRFRLDEK